MITGIPEASFAQATQKKDKKKEQAKHETESNASLLIDAKKLEITGNQKEAEDLYRKYIERYPEDPNGYFQLATVLANSKEIQGAIGYAEKALELDPENSWYALFTAELYHVTGNYDKSIRIYEKLIGEDPENLDYYYQLASLYLAENQLNDAIKTYDRIEEKIGISEEISLQKQKIHLAQKNIGGAEEEIKKLIDAFPSESKYYAILAEFYMSQKKTDKALEMYEKILLIEPENPYIHMTLADFYRKQGDKERSFQELKLGFANPNLDVDTKVNILLSFYTVNEFYDELKDEARELSDILVRTHPGDPKTYSILGDLLAQEKNYPEARTAFLQAITIDSSRYVIWEQVLRLDVMLADWPHLLEFGKRALELYPEQALVYLMTGLAEFQLKNYERALPLFQTGVKLVAADNELTGQFHMYIGDVYHALENDEESFRSYEKSLQYQPDNAFVLNNYAYYLSLQNRDLAKAEQMAKKAVTMEPENSSFQDTYGWVLFRLGRYAEAVEWIGKALLDTENITGEVLEHYGDALYKSGDPERALDYWKQALDKGDGSPLLPKKISEKKWIEN